MGELMKYFQEINQIAWGDSWFQWWFYLAVVILIAIEKRKILKLAYGFFPVCFFIVIFNPVASAVMGKMTKGWSYYARLYTILPVPICLAFSTIVVMEWIVSIRKLRSDNFSEQSEKRLKTQTNLLPVIKMIITANFVQNRIIGGKG